MEVQDIWRERNPWVKEYTRVSWGEHMKEDRNIGRASYRIDYVMVNAMMAQLVKDTGIMATNQFQWASDHKVTWTVVAGWKEVRQTLGRLQKRQIYDIREISRKKWELQQEVKTQVAQGQKEHRSLEQMEAGVKKWMGENLKKTRKYRAYSEKGKLTDDGVRWTAAMDMIMKVHRVQVLDQAIRQLEQAVDMASGLVMCEKESKQELINIKSMIKGNRLNKVVLPMWISKAQKVIGKEMKRAVWDGKKLAGKAWKAEVTGGETYMPWTRLVYSQGKVWGLPEIGIVSLLNKQGKLVMGVEKLEVMVEYIQKQWSVVNEEVKINFKF